MMGITHLAFGFLTALLAITVLSPENQILFLVLVLFASLLPDIDHPKSKIGKNFKLIALLFEHRGFTHSIYAFAIIAFISYLFFGTSVYFFALPLGYFSHLLSDSVSKEGVMFFHPLINWRFRGFIKTGSFLEYILFGLIFVVGVFAILAL